MVNNNSNIRDIKWVERQDNSNLDTLNSTDMCNQDKFNNNLDNNQDNNQHNNSNQDNSHLNNVKKVNFKVLL